MRRTPPDTVLFDLDGTLIDSIPLILSSFKHTLRHHLELDPPPEVCLSGLGTTLEMQFAQFTADPHAIHAMSVTYRTHNLAHHDAMMRRYPSVIEAVRALAGRGVRLGVVTSKPKAPALRGLEVCGLSGLFETIVAGDDVTSHKPHPAPVLLALELLGVRAETTVFVGDSPYDMEAGRRAGVSTAAALWGPFERHHLEPHRPGSWLVHPREIADLA